MPLFGKKKNPPLSGTGQILGARQLGYRVGEAGRSMCEIALRVQIPGHEPYDVTIHQAIERYELQLLRVGAMADVEVDPTNLQKVQIATSPTVGAGQTPIPTRIRANAVVSGAQLLASGQRVTGVLKSFADTGTTLRSVGQTPTRPELLDAPRYKLVIELHFPNLAPVEARNTQPVPPAQVPSLAIGLQLPCAVDPANPQQLCVVDWDAIGH
jgi:hypothetical protein